MKTILALSLAAALAPALAAQSLPAPPSGFQPDPQVTLSGVNSVRATKPNDPAPACSSDPKIILAYGWTLNPAARMMIDMILKAPQDPASTSPQTGALDEPVSKQAYKGGVLEWRKETWPVISGHPCKDSHVVFYDAHWIGAVGDKMVAVSVDHIYDSKGLGQAWIDEYIDKVSGALNSK